MKLSDAREIAEWFMERIGPACSRIEIAGSIRRKKLEVKDIEIIAIPDLTPPRAQFGQRKIFRTYLDKHLHTLVEAKSISIEKNGDKYKQLIINEVGGKVGVINLDLFLVTPPAQWGVLYTIRTGPNAWGNNFSQWIVTQRHKRGCLPNGYRVQDGAVWKGELAEKQPDPKTMVPMPEEIDFFNFLGLGWLEPENRIAGRKP